MQQRSSIITTMETDNNNLNESVTPPPPSFINNNNSNRGRVLVRSHAMREETSPPREPSPSANNHIIKLITSPSPPLSSSSSTTHNNNNINPMVVLISPYLSRGNSPCQSPIICNSPTSTLVPSPNSHCCSPTQSGASPQHNNKSSSLVVANENDVDDDETILSSTSHLNNKKTFIMCSCSTTTASSSPQNCMINNKCMKCQERNINNNNNNNNVVVTTTAAAVTCGGNNTNLNTLTVSSRVNSRGKLRQQQSSLSQSGSFEGIPGSSTNSPCLSRDSSSEQYTDTSGIDLELFIPETLNRNAKDRAFMLRIEQELVSLAKDRCKTHYKFPPMSSYQRMLVHRCAAYFGMDHNIESSGKCVVVNKTRNTRIPDIEFKEHIKDDIVFSSEEPPPQRQRSILKRDSNNSMEDYNNFKSSLDHHQCMMLVENRRSKSFEEREEEYEKVRRRIFNREKFCLLRQQINDGGSSTTDDFEWNDEIPWSSTDSENSSRYKLQAPDHHHHRKHHFGKLIKVQSEDSGETLLRPYVATKSYSFGGYGGVLNRGDSILSTHSAGSRLLTKQGGGCSNSNSYSSINSRCFFNHSYCIDSGASSLSYRLSPSSSGYKSQQSQMSESVTPSPTSTPHPDHLDNDSNHYHHYNNNSHDENDSIIIDDNTPIVWAVTNMQRVPKGSIIINPQTGETLRNDDGSIYHYDPNNPPASFANNCLKPPMSPLWKKSFMQKNNIISNDNNNNNNNKEQSQSTTKKQLLRSSKISSPIHYNNLGNKSQQEQQHNVTNSSTSPSLPYTLSSSLVVASNTIISTTATTTTTSSTTNNSIQLQSSNRNNFQFISSVDNNNLALNLQQQQPFPVCYGNSYGTAGVAPNHDLPFPPPCFFYTTQYDVPPPYSTTAPAQIVQPSDIAASSYYMDNTGGGIPATVPVTAQTITYHQSPLPQQPASYWSSQQPPITYYQNTTQIPSSTPVPPSPSQRFSIPLHGQPAQTGYLPSSYSQNYLTSPTNPTDLMQQQTVYTNQPSLQMVYTTPLPQSNQSNHPSIIYPNQQGPNIIYTQNPVYNANTSTNHPIYPIQYAQNSSTPTQDFLQLTQNMAQMNFVQPNQFCQQQQNTYNNNNNKITHYDVRPKSDGGIPKGGNNNNKFIPKSFLLTNSSQSSTGTNSPAATIVAGYCPQNNHSSAAAMGVYGTPPPETPPIITQLNNNLYGSNFPSIPPVLFKQMSNNARTTSTPGGTISRNSRSPPTPASNNISDIPYFDRQKIIPLPPPPIYHGMPYILQSDTRLVFGRGQSNSGYYRQQQGPFKQQNQQGSDNFNRSHGRGRKTKGNNKSASGPPTVTAATTASNGGKPHN